MKHRITLNLQANDNNFFVCYDCRVNYICIVDKNK